MRQLFIMATRLTGEQIHPTFRLDEKENIVTKAMKDADLRVEWVANYASMGPYDYIDVFRAPDNETAMKAGLLVRGVGRAQTEIWPVMEWQPFKEMLAEIKSIPGMAE